jgi:hypothetical protein
MSRKKKSELPQVNQNLAGFEIKINEFGEIISSFEVRQLNDFLDENVADKKLKGIDVIKREESGTGTHTLRTVRQNFPDVEDDRIEAHVQESL